MKVLFFDDDKTNLSNVLLVQRILYEIPDIDIKQAHSFNKFETRMLEGNFNVVILDIMGAPINIPRLDGKGNVMDKDLGIEMLKMIREHVFPNQKYDVIIIMRSALARQTRIRDKCDEYGANFFFAPGNDDDRIIAILQEMNAVCT